MEKEIMDKYVKAGKIAAQVRVYGASLVKPGLKVIDLAEAIDRKIISLGGKSAFPVNISINDFAAHCTPVLNEKTLINNDDYVKIDIGVHVDGYIGDTALTIKPSGKDNLIICSEKMLEKAISLFKPGTKIGEIGTAIEEVAKEFGFNPVRNLTGHGLEQYVVHAHPTIPNIKNSSEDELLDGQVFGVEPFCTEGNGYVKDSGSPLIFKWMRDHPVRISEGRKILELARVKFEKLPFAKRWIQKEISPLKVELALKQLLNANALHAYAPLREVSGKPVAQTEHTIIVKEKPVVTTL